MRNSILFQKMLLKYAVVALALLPSLSYACNNAGYYLCPSGSVYSEIYVPAGQLVGWTNAGQTSVNLVASTNPISSLGREVLNISVPQVTATETCRQPSYIDCANRVAGPYNYPGYRRQVQPTGTANIRQNGAIIGTVAINKTSTSFTTPQLNTVGTLNFLAEFWSNQVWFHNASSNTVVVTAVLDSGLSAAILSVILDDESP